MKKGAVSPLLRLFNTAIAVRAVFVPVVKVFF